MTTGLLAFWLAAAAAAAEPGPGVPRAAEYAARRARVLESLAKGPGRQCALLRSPAPARFAGDVDHPYRPDNDLYYLAGIAQDGVALLLASEAIEGLGKEVLFLP